VAGPSTSTIHVFLSHASEDKDAVARPLAASLAKLGLEVWYDEYSLKLGDSLRRSIDEGLSRAQFGIVVLSPSFFEKSWPQRELDGLVAREIETKQKLILPVWHEVDHKKVLTYSPPLADRLAVPTSMGIPHVAQKILEVFEDSSARASASPPRLTSGAHSSDPATSQFSGLPEPWNGFSLDEEFHAEFREHESYSGGLEKVRTAIYREYPDDASLTFGNRPTIVSPLYWEVASGRPRDSINGLKKPENVLSQRAYTRHSLEHDYHQTLSKIYIFDPARYVKAVVDDFKRKSEAKSERVRQISRRIEGLGLAKQMVEQYPRMMIIATTSPVPPTQNSFTSSSRFLVDMYQVSGSDGHIVNVRYSPKPTDYLLKRRTEAWRFSREYGRARPDWPFDSLDELRLYPDALARFNRESLEALSSALSDLLVQEAGTQSRITRR